MKIQNKKSGANLTVSNAQWDKIVAKGNEQYFSIIDLEISQEVLDMAKEVGSEVEDSKPEYNSKPRDLEWYRIEYEKLTGKVVPNKYKNNLDWIKDKIEENKNV